MPTQTEEWEQALHTRIANAIKAARQGRFTAQQLADETERLGYPLTRSTIANIESGRRQQGLAVAELLILAAALRVPPVSLLFPALPDGESEVLPGWHATAGDAMRWFGGETVDENEDTEPSDQARLVALTRRRYRAESRVKRLTDGAELGALVSRGIVGPVLELVTAGEVIADLNRQIATIPGAVVATEQEGTE